MVMQAANLWAEIEGQSRASKPCAMPGGAGQLDVLLLAQCIELF